MDAITAVLELRYGFKIVRIVGHGGDGQVFSATNKDGESVAIKCLCYGDSPEAYADTVLKAKNETSGWSKIGYKVTVIHLKSYRTLACVMPLLEGLSLKQHARNGVQWDLLQGSKMAVLYFEQLVAMHSRRPGMNPLAHRDIKPSNIMIVERIFRGKKEYVPVIIDWGSAHVAKADGSQDKKFPGQPMGSRGYFGPDIYKNQQTYSIDVYASIPILMHFLRYQGDCSLLKSKVFDRMKRLSPSEDIVRHEKYVDLYAKAARAPFPIVEVAFEFYRTDPQACKLLMKMLTQMQALRPGQRPSSAQCLKFFLRLHEYFFLKTQISQLIKRYEKVKRETSRTGGGGGSNEVTLDDATLSHNLMHQKIAIARVLTELSKAAGEPQPTTPKAMSSTSGQLSSPPHKWGQTKHPPRNNIDGNGVPINVRKITGEGIGRIVYNDNIQRQPAPSGNHPNTSTGFVPSNQDQSPPLFSRGTPPPAPPPPRQQNSGNIKQHAE